MNAGSTSVHDQECGVATGRTTAVPHSEEITMYRASGSAASILAALVIGVTTFVSSVPARAESEAGLRADARAALDSLYKQTPSARTLAEHAKGVLVFPNIVKAGFIVGAQYGDGVLFKGGKAAGLYNTITGSVGYQAGVEKFGYAMFFMTDSALAYLDRSEGLELGVGPEVVIVDQGLAASLSTTTAKKDIYVFYFDQKGLMAGVSIQGTKITREH
jgi:lipid-binding SYLF domain-containing protein